MNLNSEQTKTIWFIRHAESQANAGSATLSDETIAPTEQGIRQAAELPALITESLELLIISGYQRTQQTAAPIISKYPDAPVETWPLHEFGYLDPQRCAGTTAAQRKPLATAYWERCDPEFVQGPGAESFDSFHQRITRTLTQLENSPQRFILVFTHGYVLRILLQHRMGITYKNNQERMQHFTRHLLNAHIPNCHILAWAVP